MRKVIVLLIFTSLLISCSTQFVENVNRENEQNEEVEIDVESKEKSEGKEDIFEEHDVIERQFVLNENTWAIEPIDESVNENVVLITIDDAPDKFSLQMAKTL